LGALISCPGEFAETFELLDARGFSDCRFFGSFFLAQVSAGLGENLVVLELGEFVGFLEEPEEKPAGEIIGDDGAAPVIIGTAQSIAASGVPCQPDLRGADRA